jgi:hypothetical protein
MRSRRAEMLSRVRRADRFSDAGLFAKIVIVLSGGGSSSLRTGTCRRSYLVSPMKRSSSDRA